MTEAPKKKTTPKEQGNREERKMAKKFGYWIFNDPLSIRKTEGSGAASIKWSGDIAPIIDTPDLWNNHWPFHIEIKNLISYIYFFFFFSVATLGNS